MNNWFGVHQGLLTASRVPRMARVRERVSVAELLVLLLCGAAAASATGFIRLGLRIPGHAIVLAVVPMALGLAIAPRRLAGFVMSAGAFGTATAFSVAGLSSYGSGAFISLCLAGPVLDFAVTGARSSWTLYWRLPLAGLITNLLAYTSRGGSKLLGFDLGRGMRPFGSWWSQALFTYALCGAVAGLIAAICCFRLRNRRQAAENRREIGP